MTPERWQQVKELFRSALEQEVEERAALPASSRPLWPKRRLKYPAFLQFMAEMKTHWEGFQREFG